MEDLSDYANVTYDEKSNFVRDRSNSSVKSTVITPYYTSHNNYIDVYIFIFLQLYIYFLSNQASLCLLPTKK